MSTDDQQGVRRDGATAGGATVTRRRRRWVRVLGWLVAVAVWVVVCVTWLFPWLVDAGFDPTLGV